MPAKAGIQGRKDSIRRRFHPWIPAFAGMTPNGRHGRKAASAGADVLSLPHRSGARHARRSDERQRAGSPAAPPAPVV